MTIARFKFVVWNCGRSIDEMEHLCKHFYDKYECSYFHFAQQVAPTTGNLHVDGYYEYPTPRKWGGERKKFQKIFADGAQGFGNLQTAHGTAGENMDYSENPTSTTDLVVWGEAGKGQGFRQDLSEYTTAIKEGEMTAEDICLSDPVKYHQYGRTFHKMEEILLRKKFRTEMTEGIWIFGDTNVGKSHASLNDYSPSTHYLWKLNDKGWQDGYRGHPIVIVNDFRGQGISYDEMLNLVDKWPYFVPQRGKEPFPFIAKKLIVTSPMSPDEVYHRRHSSDGIAQLLRRFTIYHKTDQSSEGAILPSEHFIAKSTPAVGSEVFWAETSPNHFWVSGPDNCQDQKKKC